jgi:hypothetical protein
MHLVYPQALQILSQLAEELQRNWFDQTPEQGWLQEHQRPVQIVQILSKYLQMEMLQLRMQGS